MKKTFPRFKRGQSQKIYSKLNKSEVNIIEEFVKYVSIKSNSPKRLENNRRTLIHFWYTIEKNFEKVTLKDLRGYLSLLNKSDTTNATHNEYKAIIKRFLKWKFKDWSKRFQELEDVKLHIGMNEKRINANTLISKEDVERIVKKAKGNYWKGLFLALYESGLRPGELRKLTWDKIKFNVDGDISEINVYATKTHKARSVYVQEATHYLKKIKEENQEKNPLVFPAVKDKNKPIGKDAVWHWLTRISNKVIGRKIFPYILRHSRATELYTNSDIPDTIAQKFLGHSKSMREVYTHLSSKDVKEAMGKTIYKFEDLPEEKKHALEKEIEHLKQERKLDREAMLKIQDGYLKLVDLLLPKEQKEKLLAEIVKDQKNLLSTVKTLE